VSVHRPIRAVIFDMDGLLIDSEPHWRAAEMEVFATVGLELTSAQCVETTGLRIDEVVRYWHVREPRIAERLSLEVIAERIVASVIARIRRLGEAKEGVAEGVAFVRERGVRIGLASSSSHSLIAAVLERLGLGGVFEALHSAADEQHGKPHPAVYLTIADRLGTHPLDCLAIEDSLNGVLAAKAARMRCLAVPEPHNAGDPRFAIADLTIPSLRRLDQAVWDRL
jgi:HAD superfamily hydrolase (TIGR01549 family)